jgi:hypothetical protein
MKVGQAVIYSRHQLRFAAIKMRDPGYIENKRVWLNNFDFGAELVGPASQGA